MPDALPLVRVELNPAVGTWYLQGNCEIDEDDGTIVSSAIEWNSTEQESSSPIFYTTIGSVQVVDIGGYPVPDGSTITQLQYGAIVGIVHGDIDDKWGIAFF